MKIGVIGLGVVGNPLYHTLKYYHNDVIGYDKYKDSDTWNDILECEVIFVSVPTDKGESGRLDMTIVEEVLRRLEKHKFEGLIVLKSTLRLGYISNTVERFKNLRIAVFPEWLYANNALPGTVKPEMTVIGVTDKKDADIILDVCEWHKNDKPNIVTLEEAVLLKLTANAYASTKISFANQIMLICEKYGLDAEKVMDIFKKDPRNVSRYLTPGWSYGGYCLPKDTSEMANVLDEDNLFKSVEKINKRIKERNNE
jgi:UDPglucose 6-dehydrogenase